jgi:hypothetical protein
MMQVLKDFFSSEKGVFAYLLPMIGIIVLAAMSKITPEQFVEYAILLAGIYTGGKAIQGGAHAVANSGKAAKAEMEVLKAKLDSVDAAIDAKLKEKFDKENDDG